uniref:Uncharacterized protein n=1 Tax=Anguilla anguilla TaxID=7936 RepID=A0A0E9V4I2_ANGAN
MSVDLSSLSIFLKCSHVYLWEEGECTWEKHHRI